MVKCIRNVDYLESMSIPRLLCMSRQIFKAGTVLSILFLINIIGYLMLNLNVYSQMYSDDVMLVYRNKSYEHLKSSIRDDLAQIDTWLYNNYLTVNAGREDETRAV